MAVDVDNIAAAWITAEETWWAREDLYAYCDEEPELAWEVICRIVERAPSSRVLAMLGAGPLVNLVKAHGNRFIDRIEHLACTDRAFRECLRGAITDERYRSAVWKRLRVASQDVADRA